MRAWLALVLLCAGVAATAAAAARASEPILPKCCDARERLDARLRRCEPAPEEAFETFPAGSLPPALAPAQRPRLRFAQWPNCSDNLVLRLKAPAPQRVQWLANGSLLLFSPTARGAHVPLAFDADLFCVDAAADSDGHYALMLCPCSRLQCFSKCCPLGFMKRCDDFSCRCVESKEVWSPIHEDVELPEELDITYEILEDNEPVCNNISNVWIEDQSKIPYHLTSRWWKYPDGLVFNPLKICGDNVIRKNLPLYQTIGYCEMSVPFESFFDTGSTIHIPAAVLLFITLVVLRIVPEQTRSVYGLVNSRAMICHALSLMVSNVVLGSYMISTNDTLYCLAAPMIMYFSLVAATFWLNVLCINLTCGFNNPRGTQGTRQTSGRRTFLYYSIYAWGASAVMTALTAYMWHGRRVPKGWLRPTLMETRTCYWEDETRKMGTFAYYYGPMSGLLLVNACLFCSTVLGIRRLRRNSAILEENANKRFRRSVILYVKLLWVMGVAEMGAELAAWALHHGGFLFNVVAEVIDLARATAIFVMCVCKARTLRALRRRLCSCAIAQRAEAAASAAQGASRNPLPQCGKEDSAASHSSAWTVSTLCEEERPADPRVETREPARTETVTNAGDRGDVSCKEECTSL